MDPSQVAAKADSFGVTSLHLDQEQGAVKMEQIGTNKYVVS